MLCCLIYHVFNTLTERHLELSLKSLVWQEPYQQWDKFLLYNASTQFSNSHILELFEAHDLAQRFRSFEVFPYEGTTNKNTSADFMAQFRDIGGYDMYLVHKADFCLASPVLATLDTVAMQEQYKPWFCNFKKYDIREYASDTQIEQIVKKGSYIACQEDLGAKDNSALFQRPDAEVIQTWAVGYDGLDGVMHAYSNAARVYAQCDAAELQRSWGRCSIPETMIRNGCRSIQEDRLYVAHVFHEVPGKAWPYCGKDIPGSRF